VINKSHRWLPLSLYMARDGSKDMVGEIDSRGGGDDCWSLLSLGSRVVEAAITTNLPVPIIAFGHIARFTLC
jgi:hypothetical protein